jgi:hypothetical protein
LEELVEACDALQLVVRVLASFLLFVEDLVLNYLFHVIDPVLVLSVDFVVKNRL